MIYNQHDLGYPRTPTTAKIRIKLGDEVWDIPAQVIADSRDSYYKKDQEDTIGFIRDGSLDPEELLEWAISNMNWSDVADYAELVPTVRPEPDREHLWLEHSGTIIGKV